MVPWVCVPHPARGSQPSCCFNPHSTLELHPSSCRGVTPLILCSFQPPPPPPQPSSHPPLATVSVRLLFWLQVALFDRIHNIRVKHIQEEYQKYMERVRSKAQSAIDQANANYQHHRAMLTARVDTMVHYLQQQYLRVSQLYPHCTLALPAYPLHPQCIPMSPSLHTHCTLIEPRHACIL